MNFKELDSLVKTCEHQQYLSSKLTIVSNYDIETLITLFAQGWHLAPPKGYNKDMKRVVDTLKRLSKELEEENKKCLKK